MGGPGVGNAGLFSAVPPGLGFYSGLVPGLRPGLFFIAAVRLVLRGRDLVVSVTVERNSGH